MKTTIGELKRDFGSSYFPTAIGGIIERLLTAEVISTIDGCVPYTYTDEEVQEYAKRTYFNILKKIAASFDQKYAFPADRDNDEELINIIKSHGPLVINLNESKEVNIPKLYKQKDFFYVADLQNLRRQQLHIRKCKITQVELAEDMHTGYKENYELNKHFDYIFRYFVKSDDGYEYIIESDGETGLRMYDDSERTLHYAKPFSRYDEASYFAELFVREIKVVPPENAK